MITLFNWIIGALTRLTAFGIAYSYPPLKSQLALLQRKTRSLAQEQVLIDGLLFDAVVAVEDKRYFRHWGVDGYAIIRALTNTLLKNRLEGASTISQQMVRNLTGAREIALKRKIKEMLFAALIEHYFTKQEILVAYFNSYRFGHQLGLIKFCCILQYNPSRLSATESAQVAARFKYPCLTSNNYVRYLKRVRKIELLLSKENKHRKKIITNTVQYKKESKYTDPFVPNGLNAAANEVL